MVDDTNQVHELAFSYDKANHGVTYGDYLTWDDDERYEIIDGKVYAFTAAPSRKHQEILGTLFVEVANYTANGVTALTDSRGVKTEYTHNSYGNVIKSVEDVGGLNYTRTYNYDNENNLIQE
ncbi:hypothetical protein EV207_1581 [Scopulibacillus darangshiensis]|uniref:YD repeat-containing protein n=1 Tax=Scopulibacillus darangshiensis TaxID=442528 RepID=A0A4R2NEQ1_9BACL|nr:hypothetical protein [Scopulibacillus darangshiensis]TCP19743.1 hypothetical protein EV207_1581 [Scopulibacillus darangshiensis]